MIPNRNPFRNYSLLSEKISDTDVFDVVKIGKEFQIFAGSEPWKSPAMNILHHESDLFLNAVITDLQLKNNLNFSGFSYFDVMVYKTDILDNNPDHFFEEIHPLLLSDPFILIKTSGKQAFPVLAPEDPLFAFCINVLTGLITKVNLQTSRMIGELMIDEADQQPIIDVVKAVYLSLDIWGKAVIHVLSGMHEPGLVLLLGLVNGLINPSEYAKGLISLRKIKPEDYGQVMQEAADAVSFLSYQTMDQSDLKKFHHFISDGEGDTVEFKSTLRWDIRAGKTNPAIERASLKTIAAFLNSRGGVLLIGVRDDGSIEGIETDKFANEDKFLLHLWTLIRTCLGRDISPYIRTVLEKQDEKTICVVTCQPANRPVFLHQPGFDEELYIRIGPSSNAMIISEALVYIKERFPGQ